MLWELLARRPLFEEAEGDEDKLIDLLKYQDVPLLRTIDPSIHPDLEAIVDRAVKRSVKDRLQTAAQLADYLERYLDGKEIEIRERPWQEKFRDWAGENRALVGSVLAAVAAVVIVTARGVCLHYQFAAQRNGRPQGCRRTTRRSGQGQGPSRSRSQRRRHTAGRG